MKTRTLTMSIARRLRILLCAATMTALFVLPAGYAFARGGHGGGHGGGHAAMGHAGVAHGGFAHGGAPIGQFGQRSFAHGIGGGFNQRRL